MKYISKTTLIKILCGVFAVAICFSCGRTYQKYCTLQKQSRELCGAMVSLCQSLINMSEVATFPDFGVAERDTSDFGVLEDSARVYYQLLYLQADASRATLYKEDLGYYRPSIVFIRELALEIMHTKIEDYPGLFEKAKPLHESNVRTNLQNGNVDLGSTLDSIDAKLAEKPPTE